MITLYAGQAPFPALKGLVRDIRPTWLLEELGVPYHRKALDARNREHKSPEYLKLNPFGKFPTIQDGDFILFESAAICIYLADKYKNFIPLYGTSGRSHCEQWLFVAMSTLEPQTVRILACDKIFEQNDKTAHIKSMTMNILKDLLSAVERHLETNDYLVGNEFSIADIVMATTLNLAWHEPTLVKSHPVLGRYMERVTTRPAYKKASQLNGTPN